MFNLHVVCRYLHRPTAGACGRVHVDGQPCQHDHIAAACHVSRGRQRHPGILAAGDRSQGGRRPGTADGK